MPEDLSQPINGTPRRVTWGVVKWPDPAVRIDRGRDSPLGVLVRDGQPFAFFLTMETAVAFAGAPSAFDLLAHFLDVLNPPKPPETPEEVDAHAARVAAVVAKAAELLSARQAALEHAAKPAPIIQAASIPTSIGKLKA